jgi:hypothetical protein
MYKALTEQPDSVATQSVAINILACEIELRRRWGPAAGGGQQVSARARGPPGRPQRRAELS